MAQFSAVEAMRIYLASVTAVKAQVLRSGTTWAYSYRLPESYDGGKALVVSGMPGEEEQSAPVGWVELEVHCYGSDGVSFGPAFLVAQAVENALHGLEYTDIDCGDFTARLLRSWKISGPGYLPEPVTGWERFLLRFRSRWATTQIDA